MPTAPLISCIMPTYNRRLFVSQAIYYFLRQNYPQKELVIVDDGEDSIVDLIPLDERIRYTRLDRRHTIGAKRNRACELAKGQFIAHWDDDDWMAPQRLSVQSGELTQRNFEVCGASQLLHYRLDAGDAWRYRYPEERRPWVAGCTLFYRRRAWEMHPFPDCDVGEDSAFVWSFPPDRLGIVADLSLQVAVIHGHNAGAKHVGGSRWEPCPLHQISHLMGCDREFYVALRNGTPRSVPVAVRPRTAVVSVGAHYNVYSGYGSMAECLAVGMARAGAAVNVVPLSLDREGLSKEFLGLASASRSEITSPALYYSWPRPELRRFLGVRELFINTMWESDRLPEGWCALLNQARGVIVPTRFVAETCRISGVTVPVVVVPEGIDPAVYRFEERPERPGLTTLMVTPIEERKNVFVGIEAWKLAFAGDPDARLIIKTQYGYHNYAPDDPRIRYEDAVERSRGIPHWYRQADVLLALGNEGFGLPLVEAMATGLPVIALDSEGQSDVCGASAGCVLPVPPARHVPYRSRQFGCCGLRGVPAREAVAAQLRWVASHRGEARALGREASEWVRQQRNIWSKAPAVLDFLESNLEPKRTLRRRRFLWVPSWGRPCGVAEYSRHLMEQLGDVGVTTTPPGMQGVRLLHIQHEPSLFNEATLERALTVARSARVPTVVTAHAVGPRSSAWEYGADVIVSHLAAGVDRLRQRLPHKQIRCLPLPGPDWFPPRKPKRGRVIGAFGFLGRHKGFWQLLKVLRQLPGTELLLFSSSEDQTLLGSWSDAVQGLPVLWEWAYLSAEEVARRLAAQADILVFWYDQVPFVAASAAVRVGLATGVPVLTSRTSWFSDLEGATYQPENLVEGVCHLLDDTALRERTVAAARAHCGENGWKQFARRHIDLWQSLETDLKPELMN